MTIAAIIQARMGSTRLPGKVLRELCGRPMVLHVLDRVRRVQRIDSIILACSDAPADDPLVAVIEGEAGIEIFRGSEDDVLERYYFAAQTCDADAIIRITADCPLISPTVIDLIIDAYQAAEYDYVTNTIERSFPHGLDVEMIPMSALQTAYTEAVEQPDREHVMPFLWRQPQRFRLHNIKHEVDLSDLRWTVDTADDFAFAECIYKNIYHDNPAFDWHDVLALLQKHPEWSEINQHVQQKQLGE